MGPRLPPRELFAGTGNDMKSVANALPRALLFYVFALGLFCLALCYGSSLLEFEGSDLSTSSVEVSRTPRDLRRSLQVTAVSRVRFCG